MAMRSRYSVSLFRNFMFGAEDSLVSTVGLLSGVAIATVPRETILLTGVVLIFVEAFSMSAGAFLSESSAEDYAGDKTRPRLGANIGAALIMFFSYFVSGFIPLSPYIFWPVDTALKLSVAFSVLALFILGITGATFTKSSLLKNGLRTMVIGGAAIAVGAVAGILISAV